MIYLYYGVGILGFISVAVVGIFVGTKFGDWVKLLKPYGYVSKANIDGIKVNFTSFGVNNSRYDRIAHATISKQGLHIAAMKFFEWLGHKPFLIPWTEMTLKESGQMVTGKKFYVFDLKSGHKITIPETIKKAMDEANVSINT